MFNEVGFLIYVLGFILGYVCGSVPSGLWLVSALHGIDIRDYGSKNIGTTNVFRTVGPTTAVCVLLADMLKGIVAVALVHHFFNVALLDVVTAVGALLGHNYSLFLGFKGGKGVATALGILVFLMPKVAGVVLVIWLAVVLITRYVSMASLIAAICANPATDFLGYPQEYGLLVAIASLLVVIRHRENIARLRNGTESKIKAGSIKNLQK